jgi:hypothetical protein
MEGEVDILCEMARKAKNKKTLYRKSTLGTDNIAVK